MGSTVLVVGAGGRLAGLVVPELVRRGATVRGMVRMDAQAAVALANGAAEVVRADLRDPAGLRAAADGADGVFHVGPAFAADEAQLGLNMIDAARAAGVRRFTFSGVHHPGNGLSNHSAKQPVESALLRSGLEYTILQPSALFQNIARGWRDAVERGVFEEPFPAEVRLARVDFRDVAEVAAIALTGSDLAYGTFELCSGESTDRHDIAAALSGVLARPVGVGEPPFERWAAGLPLADHHRAELAAVFRFYAEHGVAGNPLVLRTILGRAPRTLRDYVRDHAAGVPTQVA
ncbi:NmrA family NAD(P)-binding protein [Actinomycetes bacterium KLBMP 9759]